MVNLSKRGEKDGVFQGLVGLLCGAKPEENPEEPPCQPEDNSVLPDPFTPIYILFWIGFHIRPPKMPRRFCIGLPKIYRWFRIGPPKIHRRFSIGLPQVTLNLLLPEFHSQWSLMYNGYYARKATKLPIWNRNLERKTGPQRQQEKAFKCYIRHMDCCPSFSAVTFRGPPLDSETGWTGELWSMKNSSIGKTKN